MWYLATHLQDFKKYFSKELVYIKIEIKKPSRFKDFSHKIHSKLEDILFSIIQVLPERLIPPFLMIWLEQYTNKRIIELNQQITRQRWHSAELQKTINTIHDRQQE